MFVYPMAEEMFCLNFWVGTFADKVVERIKSESVSRGTGDNWDLKVLKGQMREGTRNEDFTCLPPILLRIE